jgi:hypothetical protein
MPYPIDDIYDCVVDFCDEEKQKVLNDLACIQAALEARLIRNRAKVGVTSLLPFLDDFVLHDILKTAAVELEEQLRDVPMAADAAIAEMVGLPLPYDEIVCERDQNPVDSFAITRRSAEKRLKEKAQFLLHNE